MAKITKSDEERKKTLSAEEYRVLRESGTERHLTGTYWSNHESGRYMCAECGRGLFTSNSKFHSDTGWPRFDAPVAPERVGEGRRQLSHEKRTEAVCNQRDGHLGMFSTMGRRKEESDLHQCQRH